MNLFICAGFGLIIFALVLYARGAEKRIREWIKYWDEHDRDL